MNVMRSMATVTTRVPQWRTAAMPATSSQRYMITPPWTLPARLASPGPIQRLSSDLDSDGGLGSTAPGSLGCSKTAHTQAEGGAMPGLGGRMSTVIKAKISKMLDRAEDPGET